MHVCMYMYINMYTDICIINNPQTLNPKRAAWIVMQPGFADGPQPHTLNPRFSTRGCDECLVPVFIPMK